MRNLTQEEQEFVHHAIQELETPFDDFMSKLDEDYRNGRV